MILSMSVLAHPSRSKWHPYLREKLGDIPFSVDDGCGLIENGKKAWKMYPSDARFHCVFNDDAIIGQDFYNRASAILEKNGDKFAYSFYMGERRGYKEIVDSAYHNGKGFIISKKLFFGVAICLPVKYIPYMFTYIDRIKDLPPNRNFDTRIHRFVRSVGLRVYYSIPSLVNHRGNDENESIVYNRGGDRKAQYFIGENGEGGGVGLMKNNNAQKQINPYIDKMHQNPARILSVGSSIIFVDMTGVEHDALITHINKSNEQIEDCPVNLAYIISNQVSPQIQYMSGVVHQKHQPAGVMFWKER